MLCRAECWLSRVVEQGAVRPESMLSGSAGSGRDESEMCVLARARWLRARPAWPRAFRCAWRHHVPRTVSAGRWADPLSHGPYAPRPVMYVHMSVRIPYIVLAYSYTFHISYTYGLHYLQVPKLPCSKSNRYRNVHFSKRVHGVREWLRVMQSSFTAAHSLSYCVPL